VKAVLTEAAWAATRTKDTFFSEKYHRIAARRGKKRALLAIAHAIIVAVYIMLSTGALYKELGSQYVSQKVKSRRTSYLKAELTKLGYNVEIKETKHPEEEIKTGNIA
jgi:hypothetical protein